MAKPVQFAAVDPFDYSRLYGAEKYSIQNMLLKEVNMPGLCYPDEDKTYEVWSDRLHYEWSAAWPLLETSYAGDALLAGATDPSFLAFVAKAFGLLNHYIEVDGKRVNHFQYRRDELKKELSPTDKEASGYYDAMCKASDEATRLAALEVPPVELTGAIAVRYTNMSSGYPTIRLTAIKAVPGKRRNHFPLRAVEMETEMDRPYGYIPRRLGSWTWPS